jgi:hypothetical protein
VLENRAVPSVVSWVGGSGDWDTASNWSTGSLPTAADDVVINVANVDNLAITHNRSRTDIVHSLNVGNSTYSLSLSNGTLSLATASTIGGALTVSGGTTLTGSGNLAVAGLLTWRGGTMSGSGTTTANGGIVINGANSVTERLDGRTLNLPGPQVCTWSGANDIEMDRGATFNVQAGASFVIQNDRHLRYGTGLASPALNIAKTATLTKQTTSGVTEISLQGFVNNAGTVNVQTGTLQIDDGGNMSGPFNVSPGATLDFHDGVFSLNGGTKIVQSGTGTGSTLNVDTNAIVSVNTGITIGTDVVNLGGTLQGPANVTFSGDVTWSGGSMIGPGKTTIGGTGSLTISGTVILNDYALTLQGPTTWSSGAGDIRMIGGVVLTNASTFTIANNQIMSFVSGSRVTPVFNNSGRLIKSSSTVGTTVFNAPLFNNLRSGSVDVQKGTLQINGGSTNQGTLMAESGATLSINGTAFGSAYNNFNFSSSVIKGAGTIIFAGISSQVTDIAGTYAVTGATMVSDGTVNFLNSASTGTFSNSGGTVTINNPASGTTTFTVKSGNYTQSGGSTYLNGATLAVASGTVDIETDTLFVAFGKVQGNLTINGVLDVAGDGYAGVLTVTGKYTQSSTGTLSIDIGGATAGTQYDVLDVGGSASLSGTVDVQTINDYAPAAGTTFTFLSYASVTGDFDTQTLSGIDHITEGSTSYTATA